MPGYKIRIVMNLDGAGGVSFLKFTTANNLIRDPQGFAAATSSYIYPFQYAAGMTPVLELTYEYGIGWSLSEVLPVLQPTEIFKSTLAVGSGTGNLTISMQSLPYYMYANDWGVTPSVYCMPTTTHNRTLTVTLGTTQLYNGTVSFVAGVPFMLSASTFVLSPATTGGLVQLKDLAVALGSGTGNVSVNAKLVCDRLTKGINFTEM